MPTGSLAGDFVRAELPRDHFVPGAGGGQDEQDRLDEPSEDQPALHANPVRNAAERIDGRGKFVDSIEFSDVLCPNLLIVFGQQGYRLALNLVVCPDPIEWKLA